MAQSPRVLIVGGGIAGLAAAVALKRQGIRADVVERDAYGADRGAGLFLPANAVRCLKSLGVWPGLRGSCAVVERQRMSTAQGELLGEAQLDAVWGLDVPSLGARRTVLYNALLAELPRGTVQYGQHTQSVRVAGDRVEVGWPDGTCDHFDLVVGADGASSAVRRDVFGGPLGGFAGESYWRAVVRRPVGVDCWLGMWGDGWLVGLVPVDEKAAYCFVARFSPQPVDDPDVGRVDRLADTLRDWADPVPAVVDEMRRVPVSFVHSVRVDVDMPVRGRVVLVGDAAHANAPSMAQGAALALEDACVLAECIKEAPVEDALSWYSARRRPRVEHVRDATSLRTEVSSLPAEVRNPVLTAFGEITRTTFEPLVPVP